MTLTIANQLGPEVGALLADHPAKPTVLDDPFPAEPWRVPEEAGILVTGGFSAWRECPIDWTFSEGLKWVQTQSTGVEVFPKALMQKRVMTCGRGLNAVPIAEFVLAAIMRVEKRLDSVRAEGASDWRRHDLGRLFGRTLGLVGYGSIGQAIARRALAFDMRVLVARRTPWQGEHGIEATDLADLAAMSDHMAIAAPLTPQTEGMIGETVLRRVKPGLHLVNISRGGLVDQDALLAALRDGRIGQATLDVTSPEPLPDGHPFYSMPNVLISPHISWSGGDQDTAFRHRLKQNLDAYLSGSPLKALVDPVAGY